MGSTLYEKIWNAHVVATGRGGRTLLYIDRHLLHDGSFHAFEALRNAGRKVRRPGAAFATPDHYVPTTGRENITHPIVHVIGPEQGITQPGITLVCGDSHTSTHGALGALAFGIGASEVAHVLATQTQWQAKSRTFRVTVDGRLAEGVYSKDIILALIAKIGAFGSTGHTLEFTGDAIRALSMEARMTVCNMSIEAGARSGLIAPDETTFEYLAGRPHAPRGADWDRALERWRALPPDPDARYDREAAVWALAGSGLRAWIAPSFGDIFFENSFKNCALSIVLPLERVAALRGQLEAKPGSEVTIDLPAQTVRFPDGALERFQVDPFRKGCLVAGIDEIELTLRYEARIAAYEARQRSETPWLFDRAIMKP